MRAITVIPGKADTARLDAVPMPDPSYGSILVRTLALGICGTDVEICAGDYGWAPEGEERLILGHESLGVVQDAPPDCGFAKGDLVVGIVRRPDPVPCPNCAVGEWDMCRNGQYTERGIKSRHGYGAEFFRIEPEFAVKLDPALGALGVLLEPATVLAKAWEHIERIGARAHFAPRTVLITGAGPIGLLAAMMGVQRGLDVHVLDRVEDGPKPELVKRLGAHYHTGPIADLGLSIDIALECTGASEQVFDLIGHTAAGSIVCLAGVSAGGHLVKIDGGIVNRTLVLENDVVFGTVNANKRHYDLGAAALAKADQAWLAGLITRRVPLIQFQDALKRHADDIKVVIEFDA